MTDFSIKRYEWTHRPVLIFAPSNMSPSYLESMIVLNRNVNTLNDRDIVLIEVFEDGTSRADGREIPDHFAAALRNKYEVESGSSAIVLVGKDGTEKDRWETLPALNMLLRVIDAMPMRQREMQRDESADPK